MFTQLDHKTYIKEKPMKTLTKEQNKALNKAAAEVVKAAGAVLKAKEVLASKKLDLKNAKDSLKAIKAEIKGK